MSFLKNVKNRVFVGVGNYPTVKDAIDWFNVNAVSDTEIFLDGGVQPISDTIVVNNQNYFLRVEGLGSTITTCDATTGLTGKPMFDIRSACDFNKVTLSGSNLSNYGDNTNEVCFLYDTSSQLYSEITDIIIDKFNVGIKDNVGTSVFMFNFLMTDCSTGYWSNYDTTGMATQMIDLEVGNFEHCQYGVNLSKAGKSNFYLAHLLFKQLTTPDATAISYGGSAFSYGEIANIFNCTYNDKGKFLSGFDWTSSRDANIEVSGNVGSEDKNPHAKINVVDGASNTTITTGGTYYKAVFTNGLSYTCKMGLSDGRMTYLGKNITDGKMWLTGCMSVNQTNRNLTMCIRKNIFVTSVTGNGATVTVTTTVPHHIDTGYTVQMLGWTGGSGTWNGRFAITSTGNNTFTYAATGNGTAINGTAGALISQMTVRTATTSQPYPFSLAIYLDGVQQNDYFEPYVTSTNNGDVIIVSDVNWLYDAR
jgi:hypothetical protein